MAPDITITNFFHEEVLTYPLAILRGITPASHRFIHITSSAPPFSCIYPVVNGAFTALYELRPGTNTIRLSHNATTLHTPTTSLLFTLVYSPPNAGPYVRLVYLLAADSDGSFQSPDPPSHSSLSAGVARLRTAGLMIQAACADMMRDHNFQRRTFRLSPEVLVHRLPDLPRSRAFTMSGMDLWGHIVNDLANLPDREDTIDIAIMSFTQQEDGEIKSHTALGGGPLALFGGGSLFTWPASVHEIGKRLRDWRLFDSGKWFDDSAGRAQTMGRRACTATTLGAVLHELGHTLSLPHPTGGAEKDGGGIMARGFDHFDRLFVQPVKPAARPFWDRGSAVRLRHHRYLQFEGERAMRPLSSGARPAGTPVPAARAEGDTPPVFVKDADGIVICTSSVGIGHVGYYKNGDNASHEEFIMDKPREFCLPSLAELRRRCRATADDKLVVSAIDIDGRITDKPYEEL